MVLNYMDVRQSSSQYCKILVISPSLFLVYFNDLLYELERSGLGICIYNLVLSSPTVADDMLVASFFFKGRFRGFDENLFYICMRICMRLAVLACRSEKCSRRS